PSAYLRPTQKISLRGLFDRHMKAQRLELLDVPAHRTLVMTAIEIVRPQFLVGHAVAHDVVGDLENLMAHGDDRLLVAALTLHAVVARLQGAVPLAGRRQGGLDQRAPQIPIALARFAAATFPG